MRAALIFALPALAWCAQTPSVDLVLLLQDSAGVKPYIERTSVGSLHQGDRVSIVSFTGKTRVRLPFSEDYGKAANVIGDLGARGYAAGGWLSSSLSNVRPHVWEALADAAQLFDGPPVPSRKRIVVTLFADEDQSTKAAFDDARRMLLAAHIALGAVAVAAELQVRPGVIESPFPRHPDSTMKHLGPIPERTFAGMDKLAAETLGGSSSGAWDLVKLLEEIRRR